MKNKEFLKLLKKNKSNSGFTLTELLVGLFMSIFVVGALGFGLVQVLRTTQSEDSKIAARNESARALEFITDELRRAQAIEVDMSSGNLSTVAPNYSLPTGGTARLALQIPGVSQRVIYSVAPPQNGSPWKGPLVIYRWGPDLTSDGSYNDEPIATKPNAKSINNPTKWTHTALVDGISDTEQTQACDVNNDGTAEDITYKGFFACVVDNDGDRDASGNLIVEDATDIDGDGDIDADDYDEVDLDGDGDIDADDTAAADRNGDGEINAEDGADVDGLAITAQLYFTGGTKTAFGENSSYSTETQAVARARTAPDNNSEDLSAYSMSFRTLDPSFSCNSPSTWEMRTDFGESLSNPSNFTQWNHKENRQPQPISITSDTLVISSIPRNPRNPDGTVASNCRNSRENNGRETNPTDPRDFSGNASLGESETWTDAGKEDVVAISHVIDFNDPRTFNGDPSSCTSYPCASTPDGNVLSENHSDNVNPVVKMLKHGSVVPNYGGFDANNDGDTLDVDAGDQPSLGEFLHNQTPSLADVDNTDPDNPIYTVNANLNPDERIIGFEIGHTENPTTNPGFDLQDNIFIVKSNAFKQKYSKYDGVNDYITSDVN